MVFECFGDVRLQAALLDLPASRVDLVQTHYDVVEADGEFRCALWELTKDGLVSAI